jgi:hypothetical protein
MRAGNVRSHCTAVIAHDERAEVGNQARVNSETRVESTRSASDNSTILMILAILATTTAGKNFLLLSIVIFEQERLAFF